ncbi:MULTISPECIES: DUF4340 domain-containing protein [unclassified Tolypothrix]|uniref:DUF4340 domain-containing protein n=1 Tax=unclassified Tolypothrix TaxID=2649714 RepID=UPI0005EAADE4|nr:MULTISPECIES: DUF4340 domain-containing protein [unclassified Tolypothrix]EKE99228.1 hypothetical protein FDUTEX481_03421 [Tolypothrix sp. PCC 7601]UYD28270.1 DUF4340 domain-containing protein [Tolypothrix sp. PCC 7712]UYD35854.1 DUF4340 domain-containing protein [Tolypothrix sp. PCC 7601]BAY94569.1 hypothetical protein NIES3275_66210 [Microchaete diplosiphon NIES-3275]
MKFSRTTLILILLALGLGSFVYFYEIRGATQREEVKEKKQQIFTFTADDVQSLKIATAKLSLALERNPQDNPPKWLLKSPVSEPANDAIVSYLMDLLVKGKSDRSLSIPANQKGDFGLDNPQATINITLKNQQSHQLLLGTTNFNRRLLYVQADPSVKPDGNIDILLVSTDFENAVNRDLSEWKQTVVNNDQTPIPTPSSK